MKTLLTKLFAVTFIIALTTSCASVTDAGLTQPEEPAVEEITPPTPDPVPFDTDSRPIVVKPW